MEMFRATVTPEKKLYKEAGPALLNNTKSVKVLLMIGIISMIAGTAVNCFIFNDFITNYLITVGAVWVVISFILPYSAGSTLYRQQSKKHLSRESTYIFSDSEIAIESSDSSARYLYSVIEGITETESIFCLFINKQVAFVVPKAALMKTCDRDFVSFLEEKTGQKIKFVTRPSAGRTALKCIGVVVLSIILTVGSVAVNAMLHENSEADFSFDEYTITLNGTYYEDEDTDSDLCLCNDSSCIVIDRYTQADVDSYTEKKNTKLKDFAGYYFSDSPDAEIKQISASRYFGTCSSEADDTVYYNFFCIDNEGSDFWVTWMYCLAEDEDIYSEKFTAWADTITYSYPVPGKEL